MLIPVLYPMKSPSSGFLLQFHKYNTGSWTNQHLLLPATPVKIPWYLLLPGKMVGAARTSMLLWAESRKTSSTSQLRTLEDRWTKGRWCMQSKSKLWIEAAMTALILYYYLFTLHPTLTFCSLLSSKFLSHLLHWSLFHFFSEVGGPPMDINKPCYIKLY